MNVITQCQNLAAHKEFKEVPNNCADKVVQQPCGRIKVTTDFLNDVCHYERVDIYICLLEKTFTCPWQS